MSGHAVGNELTIQTLTWDQRDRYIYLERVTAYDDHLTFEFKSGIEIDITM